MYIPLKIASKYIFSKKNKTFINFLSIFSIASLAVGTAAMIIILSVFNGLEESLKSIYRDFDPDLKIISSDGSYIRNELANEIYTINNVDVITPFIENKSLLQNNGKEVVSFIKGVDKTFINQGRVVNNLTEGEFNLFNQKSKNTIIGRGIKYGLGINTNSNFESITAFVLNDSIKITPQMLNSKIYQKNKLNVVGVFAIENNFDSNYIFTSLSTAQNIFNKENMISGYEIKLKDINQVNKSKDDIKKVIGKELKVLSFSEIRGGLYKILETEKLVVYAIFSMILVLSSLNIFFLLIMMSVEKKKDISVMYSLGIKKKTVRYAFILQGVLIGLSGIIIGLFVGVIISLIQHETGFVKINLPNSIISAYPIQVKVIDLVLITSIVLTISTIASIFPSMITSSKKNFETINQNLS
ncbi:MAG: ABC transporter permease [Cytophagales bacterium]|nr:MAG: hypothetical protein CNE34_01195 [Rhodothermaeota bacterium MED-G18]|tara:strand:- start:251 stop:1489 length:1239 start_codon:yes stop_codon:yes gene_type:complete